MDPRIRLRASLRDNALAAASRSLRTAAAARLRALSAHLGLALLVAGAFPAAASAQLEFHFQYGRLLNPFAGSSHGTPIVTVQHAAQWRLGDTFFFLDYLDDGADDGLNDRTFYGEWYPTLSLGKLAGRKVGAGRLLDFSVIAGVAVETDANVLKYLPGVRASWDVPGFYFVNTDFMMAVDASDGVAKDGAPSTGNGFVADVNWGAGFMIGSQGFRFSGHAEYGTSVDNELGEKLPAWILAQPQLAWDVSGAAGGEGGKLFAGVEWQYWRNKLGAGATENVVQLLVIWTL